MSDHNCLEEDVWDHTHPWESPRIEKGVEAALRKLLQYLQSAMWCLPAAGRLVVHQYIGATSSPYQGVA